MNWRYLLLPVIVPLGIAWVVVGVFVILIPTEAVAISLMAIGEEKRAEAVMELGCRALFFETPPWTWLRA